MRKKKPLAEFRYYEIPQNEPVLALMGGKWKQVYGENIDNQHFHNLLEIGFCHYGEGDLVMEDEIYRFGTSMISCIPANLLHVTRSDDGVTAFWEYIYIDPEKILRDCAGLKGRELSDMLYDINKRGFFIDADDNPMIVTLVRAIFTEMEESAIYHQDCVKGLVYTLLYEIARFNGKSNHSHGKQASGFGLEKAIDFVENNYMTFFKIQDLASKCGMSETHFRRLFLEKMNMTPVEYVNFIRVKKACEIIDKTDICMEDVASRVGFETPSTFNRNFKKIVGTSPYKYKKRPDNHEGKIMEYKISALKGW